MMLNKVIYDGDVQRMLKELESRKEKTKKEVNESVEIILEDVKENGDEAIKKYAKKFDDFQIKDMADIIVKKEEVNEAIENVGEDFLRILERTRKQILEFHKNQLQNSWSIYKENGVIMGQLIRPIEKVALYVPGGTAAYPSTVLMNAIPAKLAGVKQLIMITPVKNDGKISSATLAAAYVAGVDKIYKIGGVYGIGAVAYSTQTVEKVDKIVGPGNIYVATAKKMCYGVVDIDMIAGPSEIMIIADKTANPRYVAADLMSQAEHDKMASAILITTDEELINKTNDEIKRQLKLLNRTEIIESSLKNYGKAILVNNMADAFKIANEIAPEHLEILLPEPMKYLPYIYNAGSIFLGEYTPEPLGDYMSGTNHVLPTGGSAKFYSSLGVYDFCKYSSYSYYSKNNLREFKDDIIKFANFEGLDAHANSISVRFEEN